MTNRTKIEDLLTTRKQLLTEAATCVADAVIDRQKNSGIGNIDSNVNDIEKLIAGFSEDEKVKILEIALVNQISDYFHLFSSIKFLKKLLSSISSLKLS